MYIYIYTWSLLGTLCIHVYIEEMRNPLSNDPCRIELRARTGALRFELLSTYERFWDPMLGLHIVRGWEI